MPSSRAPTVVVASALFMESLVSTVTLKPAFTAYCVALAIFIPVSGCCADRYGGKTVARARAAR